MNTPQVPRGSNGFTLIELLTVIAIIGILAAIIIPTVGRVRESARGAVCKSNLRQIGFAVQLYGNERGFYPPSIAGGSVNASKEVAGQVWVQFLRPYLSTSGGATGNATSNSAGVKSAVAVCPSRTLTPPAAGDDLRTSYSAHPRIMPDENSVTPTSTKQLIRVGRLARPTELILMTDGAQQAHGGANSTFYGVPQADSATTSNAAANTPIATDNDVDPATSGFLRYRHSESIMAVFVDGHVNSFKKGEVLNKNVNIGY